MFLSSQGHLREGKCHLSLGNAMAASRCFQRVIELDHENAQAEQEVRYWIWSLGDWSSSVAHVWLIKVSRYVGLDYINLVNTTFEYRISVLNFILNVYTYSSFSVTHKTLVN